MRAKLYNLTKTRQEIQNRGQFDQMLSRTVSPEGHAVVYIDGSNIAAQSIYGGSIKANTIEAEHIRSGSITSDHITTAGITADNIKGSRLQSIIPVSNGGTMIDLDTGNFEFAGGSLSWNNTTKKLYINAETMQVGGKNVLNTDTNLAQQINNQGTTRIQGNRLHFTNDVLIDNGFIENLTGKNAFVENIRTIELDANMITSGSIDANKIEVTNLSADNIKSGTLSASRISGGVFDGEKMTVTNLSATSIVTGTLDVARLNLINLTADSIKGGNLDISGGVRITSGDYQIMTVDPDTLNVEFNVNKLSISGKKLMSEEDRPGIEQSVAESLEGKIKPYTWFLYADTAQGTGWSENPLNKKYLGTYVEYSGVQPFDPSLYSWVRVVGESGGVGADATVAYLTNDTHVVTTDARGNGGDYTDNRVSTQIIVMKGDTDITHKYTINANPSAGVTGSLINRNTYSVTELSQDNGEVQLTASKDGVTIKKVFQIIKSKQGVTGEDAISYQLKASHLVIVRNTDNQYVPASIELTGHRRIGTGELSAFSGYFRVYEEPAVGPRALRYQSTSAQNSLTYSPNLGISSIYIEFFSSSNFSQRLDAQTVAIIEEPKPNYRMEMSSSQGTAFNDQVTSTVLTATLYRGNEDITSETPASHFIWERFSNDTNGDIAWNLANKGKKSIQVTKADVGARARFKVGFWM